MEYTKRRRYTVKQEHSELSEIYPHDIQLFKVPPAGELSLKEFQDLGLERRQVLQLVESITQRTDLKTIEDKKLALLNSLRTDGFNYPAKLLNGHGCSSHTEMELQARRRDHISHFILRLAYCQNMELKRWFLKMETEYFKLRFTSLNKEGLLKLLSLNNYDYIPISQDEKDDIREYLHISTAKVSTIDNTDFYKIPFINVSDLVRGRKVYVHKGFAYVPQSELVSLFISEFKSLLSKAIENAASHIKNLEDDDRLNSYLKSLPNVFSGMTRAVWSTTAVPIESLDELSRISYPMCMRSLHESLKADSHLKNSGRTQYGLFLKGIGVTLEDAIRFWRLHFTKKMDVEKFEKQYLYNIRHCYGKEGRQVNYTPYGCNKIIMGSVGPGDNHGCPFKHMSHDLLNQKLTSYGLPASGITDALKLAKEGHYLLACTKCFEVTHKSLPERPFVHPNGYFAESRELITKSLGLSQTNGNTDKLNQSSKIKAERVSTTPSRNFATSSRNFATPSRNAATPSRSTATPSRSVATPTTTLTPKKLLKNIEPLDLDQMLNDAEIEEMSQIMEESVATVHEKYVITVEE